MRNDMVNPDILQIPAENRFAQKEREKTAWVAATQTTTEAQRNAAAEDGSDFRVTRWSRRAAWLQPFKRGGKGANAKTPAGSAGSPSDPKSRPLKRLAAWWPSADQLRWSLQAGASAGLAALLLTFIPVSRDYFERSGAIGPVTSVVALERTAGGSLRRAWIIAIFNCVGAVTAYVLFTLCTVISGISPSAQLESGPDKDSAVVKAATSAVVGAFEEYSSPLVFTALIFLCVVLVTIPVGFMRFRYPSLLVGISMGFSTAEIVLLAGFASRFSREPFRYALRRVVASTVGGLCTVVASQCVMAKAARPTAANSLATILTHLSAILQPLALLGRPDAASESGTVFGCESIDGSGEETGRHGPGDHTGIPRFYSSSVLLFSSYPNLLPHVGPPHVLWGAGHPGKSRVMPTTPGGLLGAGGAAPQSPQVSSDAVPRAASFPHGLAVGGNVGNPLSPSERSEPNVRGPVVDAFCPEQRQCETMMENITKCQQLLTAQKDLIQSASQEISCKKPHRFPTKKYSRIVQEIQTLFIHIASLVFAVNLYIGGGTAEGRPGVGIHGGGVPGRRRRDYFRSAARWRRGRSWRKRRAAPEPLNRKSGHQGTRGRLPAPLHRAFWTSRSGGPVVQQEGALAVQVMGKEPSTPQVRFSPQVRHRLSVSTSSPALVAPAAAPATPCLVSGTPSSLIMGQRAEGTGVADYSTLRGSRQLTSGYSNASWPSRSPCCDVWEQAEGAALGRVAHHIAQSLALLADCLRGRHKTTAAAFKEIGLAGSAIAELERQRREQRQCFAQIILTTLEADVTGHWKVDGQLKWVEATGIDAETYGMLTEEEKLEYWDAYWLGRDRISSCGTTLHVLKDSLVRCSRLLDDYIGDALKDSDAVFQLLP